MSAAMAESIQADIDMMTRRLELEKRRLQRLEKELAAAQRTYQAKSGLPVKDAASAPSRPPTAPRPWAEPPTSLVFSNASTSERAPSRGPSSNPGNNAAGLAAQQPEAAASALYKTLLHRLDVHLKKLSIVKHENASLQQEIDQVRKQRLQLNSIFERLKSDIKHRSVQLMDVNEETVMGKMVQGDAEQRVAVMGRQREAERAHFKEQVLRIRRDLQDYEYERKEVEVKLKRAQDGVQKKKGLIMPEEEHEFSEPAMMRRIMKTAFLNCIQRRHIKQHEKTIAVFEQAFATIKQSTGISNIEEIVRIFVHLESKNYSLLTYVNHMNREIEALEGLRLRRQQALKERTKQEERQEHAKEEALGPNNKQLQARQDAILASREACAQHRDVLRQTKPHLQRLCLRIQEEFDRLRRAAGPVTGEELARLPLELREEAIPEWLSWAEKALSRFRDLLPNADRDHIFPPTAAARVKQMPPKRQNAPQPLVRIQELPSSISMVADDAPTQKRSNVTAAQKAEILDEEAEEEDFADRPLAYKDIRQRAQAAAMRRRKRARPYGDTNGKDSPIDDRRDDRSASRRWGSSLEDTSGTSRANEEDEEADDFGRRRSEENGGESADDDHHSEDSPRHPMTNTDSKHSARASVSQPKAAARRRRSSQLNEEQALVVNEEELDTVFLKRYKMSREELQVMADRMGIHLSNLCFLKQEFDFYDEDRSGYIDAGELKGLLKKLGEELADEDLESAFKELDQDGSGEIEFFEFVEWFTSSEGS